MVTNTAGGYSRWKTLALTGWREDATCDNGGPFCYIRDLASGHNCVRRLYEVPVGFKWFSSGLLDGSLVFGGEKSAGATFLRGDGSV